MRRKISKVDATSEPKDRAKGGDTDGREALRR